jgi:hypothetical protein
MLLWAPLPQERWFNGKSRVDTPKNIKPEGEGLWFKL